jgi:hypothetical protein
MAGLWVSLANYGSPNRSLDLAMYSARLASATLWKLGEKKGIVRSFKNGEVWYFSFSMAVLLSLYELDPSSIPSGLVKSTLEKIAGARSSQKDEEI